jgi:glycosyltransferase involved in cell wall biosynthesis
MTFSIIVAYRNREIFRVQNFLNSLAIQTYKDFEIIFVNQGSELLITKDIESILEKQPNINYIYNDTRGKFWNKSNALNIGIKRAKGDTVIIADIDLIFSESFLASISKKVSSDNFLTFNAFYLTKDYDLNKIFSDDDKNIFYSGFNGLCVIPKNELFNIRGYDEFFQIWGCEDDDIIKRLEMSGLKRYHVTNDKIPVYHQWHVTRSPSQPSFWYLEMVKYLFENNTVSRNDIDWGLSFNDSKRYIFELISSKKFNLVHSINQIDSLYVYNEFIKKFYDSNFKTGSFEIKFKKYVEKTPFFIFKKKKPKKSFNLELNNFLEYFINKNIVLIKDYYYEYTESTIKFYYIKN